jgi:hypothetical protein
MMMRLIAFTLAFLTGAVSHALGAPNARQNMELVNRSIAAEFGKALEPYIPNQLCVHDNYCQGLNSEVVVTTVGQTIDALPSSYETIEFYHRTCSANLSGLGDIHPDSARQYMAEIFNAAAQRGGDARAEIAGITARAHSLSHDARLRCEFVR